MPLPFRRKPELPDVATLAMALEAEDRENEAARMTHARQLSPRLAEVPPDDIPAMMLAWLDARQESAPHLQKLHQQADSAWRLTGSAIALMGALVGAFTTLGVFYFDGAGRVNVVAVLAVLVGLPALLLVPWALAALPSRLTQRIPGLAVLAVFGRMVNGGRLARGLWRVFPSSLREAMAVIFGQAGSHQARYASLQRWALLRWSQLFALSFQTAALAACLMLVVFTDLAFGWSTTLTTGDSTQDAQRVHRITSALATPWRGFDPAASPTLALIEESRFFRVAAEPVSSTEAARLGGWWRFVALTLLVYGVLPRAVTLAIATVQFQRSLRTTFSNHPGARAVLRRLHRASLATAAETPEMSPDSASNAPDVGTENNGATTAEPIAAVVKWSSVPLPAGAEQRWWPTAPVFDAGGGASVAADTQTVDRVAAITREGSGAVLIAVKAWEPPLMDFIDFVVALRAKDKGPPATIFVLPVGLAEEDTWPTATPVHWQVWQRKLATVGDPWLRVVADPAEVWS
jgi:hypothetical protein